MKTTTKLWIGLAILIILSPISLMLPDRFKAGAAWGEWGIEEIKELIGYIPQGLQRLSGIWNAPIPDYAFKGWEEKSLSYLSFAYIISAILGIAITVLVVVGIGRIFTLRLRPSTWFDRAPHRSLGTIPSKPHPSDPGASRN